MVRAAATFKQTDLTRALKGAHAAGMEVAGFKIAPDGSIEVKARGDAASEVKSHTDEHEDIVL